LYNAHKCTNSPPNHECQRSYFVILPNCCLNYANLSFFSSFTQKSLKIIPYHQHFSFSSIFDIFPCALFLLNSFIYLQYSHGTTFSSLCMVIFTTFDCHILFLTINQAFLAIQVHEKHNNSITCMFETKVLNPSLGNG
jgi:hypothetical protein